jgi:hypothetical protein
MPNKPTDSSQGWLATLTTIIPRLQNRVQVAAFALVILLLIIQFARGVGMFGYALPIVAALLMLLTPSIARRIETSSGKDVNLVIFYLGIIVCFVVVMVLAFLIDRGTGPLNWSGGDTVQSLVDALERNERVEIALDEALSGIVICPEIMFQGQTARELLEAVAFENRNCLVVTGGDGVSSPITLQPGARSFTVGANCDTCSAG